MNTGAEDRIQEARTVAYLVLEGAVRGKVSDAALLRVSEHCSYADFIVILEGRSDRQVAAMADRILEALEEQGIRPLGVEGRGGGWVLLDLGSVVVHIFRKDLREFYDLEGLWVQAPREDLSELLARAGESHGEDWDEEF